MSIMWPDIVGMTGVAVILISYFLLQSDRMKSSSLSYSISNACGAGMVMFSLAYDFNLSAFTVEVFWIAISIYGIFKHWKGGKRGQSD